MQPNLRLLTTTFTVLFLFAYTIVNGQAIVTADQEDYMPLSTAVFRGSGFAAFETVTLKVKNLNQPCNTVTTDSSYFPWTVVADDNGAFVTSWTVCDCPGDSLRLKALGQTSGLIAYAYFTDASLNSVSIGTTSQTVNYGTAAFVDYTVSVRATGGSGATSVSLNATGLPAGVSFFWSSSSSNFTAPNTVNFTAAATVDVKLTLVVQDNTNVPASPNFTVTATSSSTSKTATGTLTINRKVVTGGITAADKVYDGNNTATISLLPLTGVLFSDDVSLSGGTAAFADENVGAKTVTATGLTLSGSKAGNYTLSSTTATATATITAKPLTAVFSIADKIYDGNTSATITDRQLVGVIGNEKVTLTGGTASFSDKNVGAAKVVTVTNPMGLSGTDAGNYSIGTIGSSTASITFRTAVISFVASDKIYDGTTTATITSAVIPSAAIDPLHGLIAGDVVVVDYSSAIANFSSKDVANTQPQPVNASGFILTGADGPAPGGNGNYQVNAVTSFTSAATISKKPVTVTFTANDKIYDGGISATIATRQIIGIVSADAGPPAKVSASGGTATFADKNVNPVGSPKTVTAITFSLTGSSKDNYVIIPNSATATANITPRGLAVTAQPDNRIYNGTVSSNVAPQVPALQTGDLITTAPTQVYNNKNVGTGKTLTASGLVINDGNGGNNYTVTYVANTTGIITARDINVTAQTDSRIYNGTISSAAAPTVDALQTGDQINTNPIQKYDTKNVGTNKTLTPSGLIINDGNNGQNYLIHYVTNGTGVITPKDITGNITAANKVYDGNTNATIVNRTLTGAIVGDDVSYSGGTATFDDIPVGTGKNVGNNKPVTATGLSLTGADKDNYTVNSSAVTTANITPASLTITANSLSVQYSDPVLFTVTPSGFVGGENTGNLGGSLIFTTTPAATTGTNPVIATGAPGNYTITASGFTSSNYTITFRTGTLTILQEDARLTYTGGSSVATSTTNGSSATVTISATIRDITAVTGDAAYDVYPGDIRNAKVRIYDLDNANALIAGPLNVGLVNSSDLKTGTVVFNWTNVGLGPHNIRIVVESYYTTSDDVTFCVYQPNGDFITGGGFLVLTSNSNGLKAGDAGSKNNFGFNVKYNSGGSSLQGVISSIVHRTENGVKKVYLIKGNSMTSLSVQGTAMPYTAVFNGKASIQDITVPGKPVSVDGNATLQVGMADAGEPGTSDKIGITIYNKSGGVWFTSNWDGTRTIQQLLGGGNLIVHSSSNVATGARIESVVTEPTVVPLMNDKFSVKVYPTIGNTYFTVNVQSNTEETVEIKIYDIIGRQVEIARGGVGVPIRVGSGLASGSYVLSVNQGKNSRIIRVSKL